MSEEGLKLLSSISDGMVTHVDFMYRTPEGYISIIPELNGMTEEQMVRRIISKTSNTPMVARFMYSLLNHSKPPSGYNEWFTKMASDVEQQEKMVDRLRIFWGELTRGGFAHQGFREVNEHRLSSGITINQEDLPAIYKSCVEGDGWVFTYSSDRGSFSKPPGLIGPNNAIGVSGVFEFEIRDEVVIESSMTGIQVLALMKKHIPSIPWRLNRTERVALIEQSLSLRDFHYFTFTNPMMSICSSMDETKHLFVSGRNPVTKVNMEPLIPEFTMTIVGEGIRVSCSDINLAVKAVNSIIFLMKPEESRRNPEVMYSKLDVLKSLELVDVQPTARRYSARVQCATQPSVIGDDEINDWRRFITETNVGGTILSVMNQPGNFHKIERMHVNLICTNMIVGSSDTRFANLTEGLPQCSAESRTGKINHETSIVLKCATPVIPGRVSEVSVSMKEILQGFSGLDRLGVGTILGCIRKSGLEIDIDVLSEFNPSFFSQYFPWATDAEIRSILIKDLDQLAIIPALEEILDITIYVLNLGTAVKSNQVMVNPFPPMFKRAHLGGFLIVALSGQSVDLIRYKSPGEDPLGVLEKARIASRPIESQHPDSQHEMDLRPLFKRVVSQEIQCGKAISLRAEGEGGVEADFKIPMTAPYDLPRSVGNLGTTSNLIPSFFEEEVKDVRDIEGNIAFTVGSVKMSTTKSHGNIDLFNEADMKRSAELAYTLVRWVLGFVRVNESVSSYLDRIVVAIDRDHPISDVPMFLKASSEAEAFSEISKAWPEFVQDQRFRMTQETIDALKKGIQMFPLRKETVRTSSYFDSLRSFDARCEVFYRDRIQDSWLGPLRPGEVKVVGEFLVRSVTSPRQGAYVLFVWELARVNTFDEPPVDIELGIPGFIDVSQGFSQGMFVIAGSIYVALKLPNA